MLWASQGRVESHEWVIAAPRLSDVADLAKLNNTHFGNYLTEQHLRSLIAAQTIACARTAAGEIAGFYTANHFGLIFNGEDLRPLRSARSILCNRFKLPETSVGFGALAVIDERWQHSETRLVLLRSLLRMIGLRYPYLFRAVGKNDLVEVKALAAEGWRCFHEEDETSYVCLDIAKSLRIIASQLVLRLPDRPAGFTALSRVGTNRQP
jgi:hypothetical protein